MDAIKLGAGSYGEVNSCGLHAVKTTDMFRCNGNVLEAAIAAELRDDPRPHLIGVRSVDVDQSRTISTSMERGNVSLSVYLRRRDSPTKQYLQKYAGNLVKQIAQGLLSLHARGFVHGDVKPANIICIDTGTGLRLKLIDFGCSRSHLPQTGSRVERGRGPGTSQCSAPESFLEGAEPTPAWDVWGLGCILYRMLFGSILNQATEGDGKNPKAYPQLFELQQDWSNEQRFGSCPEGVAPALFTYMHSLLELDPKRRACLRHGGSQAVYLPRILDPVGGDRWNPGRTHMIEKLYQKHWEERWLIPLAVNMLDRLCEAAAGDGVLQPVSRTTRAACIWLSRAMLTPERRQTVEGRTRDEVMRVASALRFRLSVDTCLSLLVRDPQHAGIDHERIQQVLLVEGGAQKAMELYLEQDSECSTSTEEQPSKRRKQDIVC